MRDKAHSTFIWLHAPAGPAGELHPGHDSPRAQGPQTDGLPVLPGGGPVGRGNPTPPQTLIRPLKPGPGERVAELRGDIRDSAPGEGWRTSAALLVSLFKMSRDNFPGEDGHPELHMGRRSERQQVC
ncbi:unnamed protein product [Arctogadus glacialis]